MLENKQLPYAFSKKYGVINHRMPQDKVEKLFVRKGVTVTAISEAQRVTGIVTQITLLDDAEFNRLLGQHFESNNEASFLDAEKIGGELDLHDVAKELAEPEDLLESDDDAPIIRLINALITEAIKENASDIHVEPFETRLSIRFRIDGVLRDIIEPPRQIAGLLVSRIKVMAKLDIAEKRLPQDGRIALRIAGRPVDIRVSTLPSGHGERVVMRLLDKQAGRLDLNHLGMAEEVEKRLRSMIQKPHGILLVTGPTGSGKTTTLYGVLSALNNSKRNILTVEDPIEYDLDGIGQTPVNVKVNMTFAKGLRAILRQDPDVVMVGEIRDSETAQIAVQASLTGHLVLSTLHTNSAVGAITRLQDMGVEPFLLSSSLLGVLSQRLVRNLCPDCKKPLQLAQADLQRYGLTAEDTIYQPVGCPSCIQMGFKGRSGIYELIEIDAKLSSMIHDQDSQQKIEKYCRTQSPGIVNDGLDKVRQGITSLDEVFRITKES
ncbi:MAG: type II secretion system ATPase GspE [Gammaproteobacteria bacterium]|nr:type II secretion system ATPase GspE [Gammaproteobacteria bacterium]